MLLLAQPSRQRHPACHPARRDASKLAPLTLLAPSLSLRRSMRRDDGAFLRPSWLMACARVRSRRNDAATGASSDCMCGSPPMSSDFRDCPTAFRPALARARPAPHQMAFRASERAPAHRSPNKPDDTSGIPATVHMLQPFKATSRRATVGPEIQRSCHEFVPLSSARRSVTLWRGYPCAPYAPVSG